MLRARVTADLQVFQHCEARKNFSAFRHVSDAAPNSFMGLNFFQRRAFKFHRARSRSQQTGQSFQRGRFPRAVTAEERH